MTAPSACTGLSVSGPVLAAAANALFLVGIALGHPIVWLLCLLLAANAAHFAVIAYAIRAHNQARQPVSTDQAGEGV